MAVSIGANTGSFTIPAGLSVGTHTIQIRETNAPSIVSSTVTFTVGSAAAIAPALGTTNLLADFDPNVAGSRTLSGSTITALSTANGPAGSVAITGSPTLVSVAGNNAILLPASAGAYFDLTSSFLSSFKSALTSGPITFICVTQAANTSPGGQFLFDFGTTASGPFVQHAQVQLNAGSSTARSILSDASNSGDFANTVAGFSTNLVLVVAQFQSGQHPLIQMNHVAAVAGNGTAATPTISGFDEVTWGARKASSAYAFGGDNTILRWSLYSGSNLTAGAINTAIASWATNNYGTP